MLQRRVITLPSAVPVAIDFAAVRESLGVEIAFPPAVEAQATALVTHGPARSGAVRIDLTAIPFVTLDPVGSMDLDQAVHLERRPGAGFRVRYAIADVGAFVNGPGPLLDETLARGQTMYCPDTSAPLHPTVVSEGAASLLPDRTRAAVVWTIDLDEAGEPVEVAVQRALVASVARLDYVSAQTAAESGTLHPSIALLPEVGRLRAEAGRRRGAIDLNLPDIEVVRDGDRWTLRPRAVLPIEQHNAQISLLTGICAATIMMEGGLALLRTLPEPDEFALRSLRTSAGALGIAWPDGAAAGDVIAAVDPADPRGAAFLDDAVRLLRGAGYQVWRRGPTGPAEPDLDLGHAGIGGRYAHVTAPLRRLVDRYATEICLSLTAGTAVPPWVLADLDRLPELMTASTHRANALDKACRGTVAVFLLQDRVGEDFPALVLQVDRARDRADVVLDEPPVRARCAAGDLREGQRLTVTLTEVDRAAHTYRVVPAS